mgnify:CR=1 FL=1
MRFQHPLRSFVAAFGLALVATLAPAQEPTSLRVAYVQAPDHPHGLGIQRFGAELAVFGFDAQNQELIFAEWQQHELPFAVEFRIFGSHVRTVRRQAECQTQYRHRSR